MVIKDLIQAFLYMQRQQGWGPAFSMAMQFLRAPFFEFHRGFVLRKSLKEPIHVPAPRVPVSIRQVTLDLRRHPGAASHCLRLRWICQYSLDQGYQA